MLTNLGHKHLITKCLRLDFLQKNGATFARPLCKLRVRSFEQIGHDGKALFDIVQTLACFDAIEIEQHETARHRRHRHRPRERRERVFVVGQTVKKLVEIFGRRQWRTGRGHGGGWTSPCHFAGRFRSCEKKAGSRHVPRRTNCAATRLAFKPTALFFKPDLRESGNFLPHIVRDFAGLNGAKVFVSCPYLQVKNFQPLAGARAGSISTTRKCATRAVLFLLNSRPSAQDSSSVFRLSISSSPAALTFRVCWRAFRFTTMNWRIFSEKSELSALILKRVMKFLQFRKLAEGTDAFVAIPICPIGVDFAQILSDINRRFSDCLFPCCLRISMNCRPRCDASVPRVGRVFHRISPKPPTVMEGKFDPRSLFGDFDFGVGENPSVVQSVVRLLHFFEKFWW